MTKPAVVFSRRIIGFGLLLSCAIVGYLLIKGPQSKRPAGTITPYEGPLFDAMTQWNGHQGEELENLIKTSQAAGVERLAIFAKRAHKPYDAAKIAREIARKNPSTVVLGTPKRFHDDEHLLPAQIETHFNKPRNKSFPYRFVSELMLRHSDKAFGRPSESGERYTDPSAKRIIELIEKLAPLKVPIFIHWEMYDWDADQESFATLFSRFPQQKFVILHMGFGTPAQIQTVLANNANVYVTISKKIRRFDGFADKARESQLGPSLLDGNDGLRPEWRVVLLKYPDRILFATDANKNGYWNRYGELIADGRKLLGQLPEDIAQKIAHLNAESLFAVQLNRAQ